MQKKKIGIFFGGQSVEHDVSILTGLQVCQVIDVSKYDAIPFYVDNNGAIWTGALLLDTRTYPIDSNTKITKMNFVVGGSDGIALVSEGGLFKKKIELDAAFLAFHGGAGESGIYSALFEAANLPYAGATVLASSVYMSKYVTKLACRALDIKVLPETMVHRPEAAFDVMEIARDLNIQFPVIVKPESLGSSVGVSRADNNDELAQALVAVFKVDPVAMIEPFVENLIEYNVAVLRHKGKTITSAIESPNGKGKLLSFDDKYKGDGGKKKSDADINAMPSDNLIESRREFHPNITPEQEEFIRGSAMKLFDAMGGTGAPRIDYLCNSKTGEVWMNEVNPIPGAFGFYLWRVANPAVSYQEIVSTLLDNAFFRKIEQAKSFNLAAAGSSIFKK
jgi:D-alanine-D-alanine ligase